MSSRISFVIVSLFFLTRIGFGQPNFPHYYITTYNDGTQNIPSNVTLPSSSIPGTGLSSCNAQGVCASSQCYYTIRDAINWANNQTTSGSPITVYIHIPSSLPTGSIILFTTLPTITLNDKVNLQIIADDTAKFRGFTVHPIVQNTIVLNSPSDVQCGLEINTGLLQNKNSTILLDKIAFNDFDRSLASVGGTVFPDPNRNYPHFFTYAPCIRASNTKKVTIQNCIFRGYNRAIMYDNSVEDMTIQSNILVAGLEAILVWDQTYSPPYKLGFRIADDNQNNFNNHTIGVEYNSDYNFSSGLPQRKTSIASNTVTNWGTSTNRGIAFSLDPLSLFSFGIFPWTTQYNVNTDILIIGNIIRGVTHGIFQNEVPPLRNIQTNPGPDLTYQLRINTNTISVMENHITYYSPYQHFELKSNRFEHKKASLGYVYDHPVVLAFGGGHTRTTSNGEEPLHLIPENHFGFKMIGTTTNHNTYDITDMGQPSDPSEPPYAPLITMFGNFGILSQSTNTTVTYPGIYFEGIDFPGAIRIGSGKSTTIKDCKLKSTSTIWSGSFAPISFHENYDPLFTLNYMPANGNLLKPEIFSANKNGPGLDVTFQLNGPLYQIPHSFNYQLHFYKSNQFGDLVDCFHNIVLQTISSNPVTLNLNFAQLGFNFDYGERLAMTVTSLGDVTGNEYAAYGTSPVAYKETADCPKCLGEFSPTPGKSYWISGWAKINTLGLATYDNPTSSLATPVLVVEFFSGMLPNVVPMTPKYTFRPSGPIVDGWQRIEGRVDIPQNAKGIEISATNDVVSGGGASFASSTYFDDIRFHSFDGSMKSYVYDGDTKQLVAELDENNNAKFFEYDSEGQVIRLKTETEGGVMTTKEIRNNKPNRP